MFVGLSRGCESRIDFPWSLRMRILVGVTRTPCGVNPFVGHTHEFPDSPPSLEATRIHFVSLSLSLFFLPGIGVVSTTLRCLARPTLYSIEWPALGLIHLVCPQFPSWHPPLYSKHENNPGLVPAPLWPIYLLVLVGCQHLWFPRRALS